jgi:hypothetical protein
MIPITAVEEGRLDAEWLPIIRNEHFLCRDKIQRLSEVGWAYGLDSST